jgi:hypothetical protein
MMVFFCAAHLRRPNKPQEYTTEHKACYHKKMGSSRASNTVRAHTQPKILCVAELSFFFKKKSNQAKQRVGITQYGVGRREEQIFFPQSKSDMQRTLTLVTPKKNKGLPRN